MIEPMEIACVRDTWTPWTTTSKLYVDGAFECYVLEDRFRPPPEPKVKGATCIPNGRYRVLDTWSPKFGQNMLEITGVPNFVGIRIHAGNKADDTEGCPLPGLYRKTNMVTESKAATEALTKKIRAALAAGRQVYWNVTGEP